MPETTDVLIAGAGPVGLMLGAELRRDGVDVRVIDAQAGRSFFVKALGVTARTLELFDDLGVVHEAIDAGVWLTGADAYRDGALASSTPVPREGLPYGALSLAQHETERILERALARHGGRVEYGATLVDFKADADGVSCTVRTAAGDARELRCRWLVGCDGARSTVRRHLNVPFEGDQYPQTFMLADVDVDWHLPRGPMIRISHSATGEGRGPATLAAVPVRGSPRRYRLSMVLAPDDAARLASISAPEFAEIERIMLPVLPDGTRLSSMRWSSVYRVSHRIAARYACGRVFLAGDAAHIHPPVGGQGMNTGLQDAHNLAWKLTLAARGLAGSSLLESYEAERRPVGLDVVESTSRALDTVLAHGEVRPAMRETQLLIGYRGSPIVADACDNLAPAWPSPGDRVPEIGGLSEDFIGHRQRIAAHIGHGRHTLIGYCTDDTSFAATVDAWRAALGDAANAVRIAAPGATSRAGATYRALTDSAGEFAAAFGARSGMIWAVRPDGHIGFRSSECSAAALTAWLDSAHAASR
ncbi:MULTISPECIES: FAD-dependent monooxygenase [unclassified Caballeronia]|uniref:FAD-dependent monooxygenase n=1 Tax=unclassified Caballeronia TaxID=2646786 RepID=UPI0028607D9E|nr:MULTISPECIES: FAD-dependent monooxygenase [unclassified Caballeronia]MDR5739515.1 FAD-dependent monooxygenase [Caballeronia sp. LZ016]MDR5807983.1 FAD-dependent monooxygenase [Caballeronia sp. LZ019]